MSRNPNTRLPTLPSAQDLGFTQVSDGKKKVPYRATLPRNVRAFQTTEPTRFVKATAASASPASVQAPMRTPVQRKPKPYPEFVISPHIPIISQYIKQYPILAVDARTGTGKTREIPYRMAKEGLKVRVAIPTTVAVRDAYNFQKIHSDLRVGYAAGREIHYSDDDQLVYATTGHFRQKIIGLVKDGQTNRVREVLGDLICIDEVHSATTDITILIALIRYLFTRDGVYAGPKILFATATFNHGDIMDHFPDFPVYTVPDVSKPIEEIFLEKARDPIKDDPNPEILRVVRLEFERWKSGEKGHGIVFRPGMNEVEETIEALEASFPTDAPIEFYPAYSGLTPQEIDSIFQPSDKMKVIVGTNLIESSITIPDVMFVVNDPTAKIAETSSTGGEKLTLTVISKAGSQQRRGRTGRTIPGRVYHLISREQYELLEPFIQKEIDRIPIYDIILQLIDAGLDPVRVLKISQFRYEQAKRMLIDFGMISQAQTESGPIIVTEAGRFVSGISLGIQNAFMVYLGYQRFMGKYPSSTEIDAEKILLRTIIAVASMIETYGPSFMFISRKNRGETQEEYSARRDSHIETYHEKFRGETDIHTFVNIFWEMLTNIDVAKQYDRATGHKYTYYVKEWALNNSMNNRKLKEFFTVMRDIESTIESKIKVLTLRDVSPPSSYAEFLPRGIDGQDGFSLGRDLPTGGYSGLGNAIAPIFARAYISNRMIKEPERRGRVAYRASNGVIYSIDRASSFNQIPMSRDEAPTEIVAARTLEMVGKTGQYHLAGIIVSQKYIPRLQEPSAPRALQALSPPPASFGPPVTTVSPPRTSEQFGPPPQPSGPPPPSAVPFPSFLLTTPRILQASRTPASPAVTIGATGLPILTTRK